MADIGAQSTMQVQHMPVMLPGANGQPVMHYIAVGGMPGTSQQQQLAAWPVHTSSSAVFPTLLPCSNALSAITAMQVWQSFFQTHVGLPASNIYCGIPLVQRK